MLLVQRSMRVSNNEGKHSMSCKQQAVVCHNYRLTTKIDYLEYNVGMCLGRSCNPTRKQMMHEYLLQ